MKARVKATGEIVEVVYLSEDKYGNIDSGLFPEVTFENSPQEVELVIKK